MPRQFGLDRSTMHVLMQVYHKDHPEYEVGIVRHIYPKRRGMNSKLTSRVYLVEFPGIIKDWFAFDDLRKTPHDRKLN